MRSDHRHCSRLFIFFLGLGLLVLLLIGSGSKARAQQSNKSAIQYIVVSQRWLTHEELSKFEDAKGYQIAIRLRLSNESDHSVEYLASSSDLSSLGYRWERKTDKKDWEFTPPSRGRDGTPGSEFTGIGYTWRVLPAHSAVETENLSYTAKDEVFAFSTFIRKGPESQPQEVVSNVIHPLFDRQASKRN